MPQAEPLHNACSSGSSLANCTSVQVSAAPATGPNCSAGPVAVARALPMLGCGRSLTMTYQSGSSPTAAKDCRFLDEVTETNLNIVKQFIVETH